MRRARGIAATGHPETSAAAAEALAAGGNAFDAVLAGLCASCVAEPLLASLGGGGFLLAQPVGKEPVLYDFFVHTPRRRPPPDEDIDFYPILADFGTARQEFHIGMASIAVPGVVAGLFAVHDELGQLPIREVFAPAIRRARLGVEVNAFQLAVAQVLAPIVAARPEAMGVVATAAHPQRPAREGENVANPFQADLLEALAREGPGLFYRGELAQRLVRDCEQHGGLLRMDDLEGYRVEKRTPVRVASDRFRLDINPPPSPGGCLIAFAMALLRGVMGRDMAWGSREHAHAVAGAMQAASALRDERAGQSLYSDEDAAAMLDEATLARWRDALHGHPPANHSTTHLSVADADGNLASLTVSNGQGCAYVLPGTGVMMNNMLGEADLNPGGFHRWPEDRRMASMMSPAVLRAPGGATVALGAGGANRIRSAILQVMVNLVDFGLPLEEAVAAPRLHLEDAQLSAEIGYPDATVDALRVRWPGLQLWPMENLFFGGVHAVRIAPDGRLSGAGDPRRGGAVAIA